ncbi:queuosine precursor transporter [Undibacterium sp. RTI2.1]|uniref:queuosine precursor transporter n=1 Tax=unclassified Undibacterium TaxID=2630295 RepID=UPI002AB398C4|nr:MULTISPECIES: queuosine precursor transporter [unclassified Undibacterium]MDY7538146.1 queuosine precursor transporter [Undibacterium sp. 5I1]MEB0031630.1 queuosine precursor transporter [Undibacterium sp. RTI2.1]MEB0116746.1 queuosine precursor transporter [Undibacterium sp. RTI2.2]MEB0229549.1 queuosine precursor transporter [Undibacterium sp. 10I3]MEB0257372.1 queuosine precursor transporter [Undibacterium sp. 5I1]
MARPIAQYKYYDFVMAAFVTVLLCSNLIGAAKAAEVTLPVLGTVTFGAGVLFFPISYIFGDILTEVYGYGRDRRVIWAGFGALIFAAVMSAVVLALKPAADPFNRDYQMHLDAVFGNTPRIVLGSMIAFWCGSFVNSYVMAKMKIAMAGRQLWMRFIGSTVCGELVDSSLFYVIAFYGIWSNHQLISVIIAQYIFKTGWEVLMTPVTYKIVAFLKRKENEDYYDIDTDFNPFKLKA